jgi:hypothetical protein
MWWLFVKLVEDASTVIYEYGFESQELTGMIEHNKKTGESVIIKATEKDALYPKGWTIRHFYKVVKEGFPDKRMIAIG